MTLDQIPSELLCGNERFHVPGDTSPPCLLEYWQWSGSSLLDNTARGVLAEFLVATALGISERPRVEWVPYDLETTVDGEPVKIEVKSSARVQSWKQKTLSPIEFNIAPTRGWNAETGKYQSEEPSRSADIYVFCALRKCRIMEHVEALNTDNWDFYVLHRDVLDRERPDQKKIREGPLRKLKPRACKYPKLRWR